jgi:SAM-dependent methyltransferase
MKNRKEKNWRIQCISYYSSICDSEIKLPSGKLESELPISQNFHPTLNKLIQNKILTEKKPVLLDVGCYIGHYGDDLRNLAHMTIGIDLVFKSLQICEKNNCYSHIALADGAKLPIKDKSVDICTIIDSLSTCNTYLEMESLVLNATKTLKPGGKIIINTWIKSSIFTETIRAIEHSIYIFFRTKKPLISADFLKSCMKRIQNYLKPRHKNINIRMPSKHLIINALKKNKKIHLDYVSKSSFSIFPPMNITIIGSIHE